MCIRDRLTASETTPISIKRDAHSSILPLVAVQVACAWVSAKGALKADIWRVSGAALAVVIIAVLCYGRKPSIALEEPLLAAETEKPSPWRAAPFLVAVAAAPSASLVAPVAPLSTSQRQRTVVQESFGFDFAEDQAENTDLTILGERRLKEGSSAATSRPRPFWRASRTPSSRRSRRSAS